MESLTVDTLDKRVHTTTERLQEQTDFDRPTTSSPQTIPQSPPCEACGGSEWEFDGLNRRPSKTVACFECVECGAALQVRLTGGER